MYRPTGEVGLDPPADDRPAAQHWRKLHELSVLEPRREAEAAAYLPLLTPLPSESEPVRAQYEEAPYPRWRQLPAVGAGERRSLLRRLAPDRGWDGALEVLIAGCGTGRQALAAAQGYGESARVLAFDTSRRSLGYASVRADRAGATNLDLALGDIMRIGSLDQRFDVIECFGVLHHLPDPTEGWRQLANLLAEGGIMQVALYRGAGRRHRAAARQEADAMGLGKASGDLRRFRRHVLSTPTASNHAGMLLIGDFYTLSGCRDLVFHARERDYTLAGIGAVLDALGLEFLGLQVPAVVRRRFTERHPGDDAQCSLTNWTAYEAERPEDFDALYRFWCRRR